MTQEQWIILALRVTLIADVLAIGAFIAIYTAMAAWWRNPIGRTLVIKDILLILLLTPSLMSLFFHFSRLTSHIAAWIDVALFALLVPVMLWRVAVWVRVHNDKGDS